MKTSIRSYAMKNSYMFLMLISILKTAAGQVEKPITAGHFLVGGSISYYSQTSKQTNYVQHAFHPSQYELFTTKEDVFQPNVILGYYLFNHLALSLLADGNTYASFVSEYSNFGIGPLIRYSTDFGLFIQGSASLEFNKNLEGKWKSQSYSLGGGYSFFIKGLLSIEPSLSYKYTIAPSRGVQEIKTSG